VKRGVDEQPFGTSTVHRTAPREVGVHRERLLRVGLVASDPITADGVTAYARAHDHLAVVSPDRLEEAEVGLLLVADFNDASLASIESLVHATGNPRLPIVVVAESISRAHLMSAIGHGLACYLPRSEARLDAVVKAAFAARAGSTYLPQQVTRLLVDGVRMAQNARVSGGCAGAGMSSREIDILTLLADGISISEVASKLNYSERTIKYALQQFESRLNLRNRVHAVAYAIRAGII
jgi:DNA-binding NarL/FixJ family response regulator